MSQSQRLSLCFFLCLSIVMVMATLARIAGYRLSGVLDLTWEIFWMWTEGGVAVIMGSATAFRTLFSARSRKVKNRKARYMRPPSSGTMRERILCKLRRSRESDWEDIDEHELPEITSATFTGMITFIRKNNRTETDTMAQSGIDLTEVRENIVSPLVQVSHTKYSLSS